MNTQDLNTLNNLLKEWTGIFYPDNQSYILETLCTEILRQHNLQDFSALCAALKNANPKIKENFIETLLPVQTTFFKDFVPFTQLSEMVLPFFIKKNEQTKQIRILSAGCSSGQETYSIAMIIDNFLPQHPNWQVETIGIDLSKRMIKQAQQGLYSQFEVQRGLPIQKLLQYFTKGEDDLWHISDSLKEYITFKQFNLLDDLKSLGKFDIVFLRNVINHFDTTLRPYLLEKIADIMNPEGCIFLGKDENPTHFGSSFQTIKNVEGIFRKS